MVLVKCSVSILKPLVSKQLNSSIFSTLKAAVTAPAAVTVPATKPVSMLSKRVKPAFTLYGSQSTTSFYPKRTYATFPDNKGKKFTADLKVTGTIQESPILSAAKIHMKEGKLCFTDCFLKDIAAALETFFKLDTSIKVMNSYRWSPLERSLLTLKLISMDKNLCQLKRSDYEVFSEAVGTRSPQQCYSYIRYHFK